MKSTIALAALSSIVGGALGSGLTLALTDQAKPAKAEARAEAGGDEEDEEAVEAPAPEDTSATDRLRTLEHRVAVLSRALTARSGDPEAMKDALDEGALLPQGASDVADPVFEAAVLDIVDREQERKEAERDTHRNELRVERSKKTAAALAEHLKLTEEEQERVAKVVTDYYDSFRALRESADRPATPREWMTKSNEMRAAMEQHLAEILSPAQFKAYQELEPEDQIGFGPGRGGPPRERPPTSGDRESNSESPRERPE